MDNWEQLDLFGRPEIKIDKKIRLIETFAGYGSQAMALERMGVDFETHFVCEFDGPAIKSYNAVHNTNYETTDIRNVHGEDLKITDKDKYCYIMTYSFPCFTGDTLVMTDSGLKQIKDVVEGDKVLTHKGEYKKVIRFMNNGEKNIGILKTSNAPYINCTPDHRFYVKTKNGKPEWKAAKNLTNEDYVLFPKNSIEENFYSENAHFWYIMGRYLADGCIRNKRKANSFMNKMTISCNEKKLSSLLAALKKTEISYDVKNGTTCIEVDIFDKEINKFILQNIGVGSEKKFISEKILNLPKHLLKSFFDGYISGDGCLTNDGIYFSTINKKIIYGISVITAKLFNCIPSVSLGDKAGEKNICGVKSQIKDCYNAFINPNAKYHKAFILDENNDLWVKVRSFEDLSKKEIVYDIEVEDDHSFTVFGVAAHNCTDLSLAGKQAGMKKGSGTRSGLLWEIERILKELVDNKMELPDILLLENVPQVVSDKFMPDFDEWLKFLFSIGYYSTYQILNAKDYGIPQNRERCFMFSFYGEDYKYTFPNPIALKRKLKDCLEPEVDEKYYLKSEKADQLIDQLVARGVLNNKEEETEQNRTEQLWPIDKSVNNTNVKSVANCLTAREDRGISCKQSEGTGVVELQED
ncbi:MAG: DNA cytosine methyltransferase [Bacilli bacterium]|nr:DNA cytosine methyltransferase [Bacilli bacterium]